MNTVDFKDINLNTYNGRVILDEIYWRAIDNTIIVCEPNAEDMNKIITFMMTKINIDGENISFAMSDEEFLVFILPVLTNIKFDLKDEKQKRLFDLVLKTEPKAIQRVIKHMNDIVTDIASDTHRIVEYLENLDEEKAKEYLLDMKGLTE